VCDACDIIHYQNPKIVAGCLPVWDDKVLLCRRAIEPRYGLWTLPAGFMENDETTEEAAAREALEEANARLEILSLYTLISLPHVNQVYVMYRARLLDQGFSAGAESLEVRLFHEHEIPWERLAFRTIEQTLRHFFADRSRGRFGVYSSAIRPDQAR
jgi:ADP-ribose pyrophosphatase YjhB (NUDIX family)